MLIWKTEGRQWTSWPKISLRFITTQKFHRMSRNVPSIQRGMLTGYCEISLSLDFQKRNRWLSSENESFKTKNRGLVELRIHLSLFLTKVETRKGQPNRFSLTSFDEACLSDASQSLYFAMLLESSSLDCCPPQWHPHHSLGNYLMIK